MLLNERFAAEAISRIGHLYGWGSKGQIPTVGYLQKRAKSYPIYYDDGRLEMMEDRVEHALINSYDLKIYDCSGLVTDCANAVLPGAFPNSKNCQSLYKEYCVHLSSLFNDLMIGDLLFRYSKDERKQVHVGIYCGGIVVEALNGESGVICYNTFPSVNGKHHGAWSITDKRFETAKDWTHAGRLKMFMKM